MNCRKKGRFSHIKSQLNIDSPKSDVIKNYFFLDTE